MEKSSSLTSLKKENAALKKRLEEVEKENQVHKIIIENQTELICKITPEGTLLFVNQAYCDFFQKSKDELTGFNIFSYIPKSYHKFMKRHFSSFTPENAVQKVEHQVMGFDGKIHWQEWINRAIFLPNGELKEFQSVGRDITHQKQIQNELSESQSRLRALFDSSLVGFTIINQNYEILEFNSIANAFSLLIYHKSIEKKSTIDRYIRPENLQTFILFMERAFEGEVVTFEYKCLSPYIWLENSFSPVLDSHGKISSICMSSIDITNQRLIDEKRVNKYLNPRILEDPGQLFPCPQVKSD